MGLELRRVDRPSGWHEATQGSGLCRHQPTQGSCVTSVQHGLGRPCNISKLGSQDRFDQDIVPSSTASIDLLFGDEWLQGTTALGTLATQAGIRDHDGGMHSTGL